jgi:hypothetical protein
MKNGLDFKSFFGYFLYSMLFFSMILLRERIWRKTMELPIQYAQKMQQLLGEEYQGYLDSFAESRYFGLRINTLKLSTEAFGEKNIYSLSPVPWCKEGIYYSQG